MTPNLAFVYALSICLAGSLVTLLVSRWKPVVGWLAFLCVFSSSSLVIYAALTVLLSGAAPALTLFSLAGLGTCRLAIDGLSAILLLLIAVIAVLSSIYSVRYMVHYTEYGLGRYYPYFLLFVAGMYGIVVVTDLMVYFCAFWQLMTLPSYALVRFESKKQENVRAANRYLLMMELSCGLVMAGAGLLGSGSQPGALGRYEFDSLAANMSSVLSADSFTAIAALLLFLVGFGIKAGMWPFGQLWLPAAHPAAPSPVSALLSGVMIKTGVYGLMRSFLWLIPADDLASYPAAAWGLVIGVLGTATLFFGTIQALKQEESKRLLAFHSIGQVGYILLGLGACLALLPAASTSDSARVLAAMALAGALFHTINHGLFKSLLFLNAGSVLFATGTQSLNRIGGLFKFMPVTGVMTLIASFSIAGVPLFNGFASKWTIYVSTVLGSRTAPYLAVLALFAILTSAITLASFIKFFGSAFLSRTSQLVKQRLEEKKRLEVDWTMLVPQLVLASGCLVFGLFPQTALRLLKAGLATSEHGLGATLADGLPVSGGLAVAGPGGHALIVPFVLALVLVSMLLLARTLSRSGGSQRRVAIPWLCGYALESEANRYTAHGLYGEVKRYLRWAGGTARR
ncbi:MAG: peroxiredoxin family protein [Acidobacteria bacterium]|nr:MAG: peroxiredoxin family protein [Acidobacteriota bacterium]